MQYEKKRICGIHFRVEDRNRNNRLKATAVPSLHLPMWCKPDVAACLSSTQFNAESTVNVRRNEFDVVSSSSVAHSNVESAVEEVSVLHKEMNTATSPSAVKPSAELYVEKSNVVEQTIADPELLRFTTAVPSVVNFIKTIEGVQNLWKILNEKYSLDTLLTRNLNQDPVENFFGNIRSYGARNVAPNCVAFEGAYKSLLLNNFNAPHSIQANCEEDKNDCLQNLDFFLTENRNSNFAEIKEIRLNEDVLQAQEHNIITDKGQRSYVCGWVLTKCYKNIIKYCKTCKKELSGEITENHALIKAREYNKKKK